MSWFTRMLGGRSRTALSSQRPAVRLRVEELERRWVPSTLHSTTSTNWAGYAVTAGNGSVTGVSATFNVPTVSGTGTAYSSDWVGIDGYNSGTVEQTGIEADVVNGVAQYSAWYEMYPAYPTTVGLKIHPGDAITASVTASGSQFTLTLTDANDPTGANSFTITQNGAGAQKSSAEWITEAPSSSRGVLPLANFTPVTFNNAQATINTGNGPITGAINNAAWASSVNQINMVSQNGTLEAGTSALNSSGLGFTVTHGSIGSPPANPTTPPTTPPPTTPPPTTPPSTGTIITTTTLTGTANRRSFFPSVTLTAIVSPSVPVGSKVELMYGNSVLATGTVQDVNGVDEVSFTVVFYSPGTYTFTASFMGSGSYAASTSNTVTVTVW